jgi:DtxR family Mn-dependent transcriptional regulator
MPKEEIEEYLEALLDLAKDGRAVKTTALSGRLGVAPASVTEAVQRLSREGLVHYEPYRGATLTPNGRAAATRIKRKHRLLEVFLTRVLHLGPRVAHDEACKLEHSLSDGTETALCRVLKGPEACPHGNPIPPCDTDVGSCAQCLSQKEPARRRPEREPVPLTSLPARKISRVVFVRGGKGIVKRLCDLGLTPGTPVALVRSAPMKGPVEILVRGCHLAIGRGIAEKIFVEAGGSRA